MRAWARRAGEDALALAGAWIRGVRLSLVTHLMLVGALYAWIVLFVYGELWPVFLASPGSPRYRRPLLVTLLTGGVIFAVGLVLNQPFGP